MASTEPVWTAEALGGDPHADAEKARKVQAMFAAIARSYDLNNRLHSFFQDQQWRRAAVRAARVNRATRVLDVACGTGDLAEAFADAGAASVTGLDFTPQMLDVARHKAARAAARPAGRAQVQYLQGDAMALPFPDASFDVVSIAFGIRNVAKPERAIAEFFRVLAPQGCLVVLEFADPTNPVVRWASDFYTKRVMPLTATLLARDRSGAYRYLPKSVSTFAQPAEFRGMLERAGFRNCTTRPQTMGVCVVHRAERPARPATL
ncbi:MAG: bifunctional demethylmenaquinone methyltransferase/2-methoxy-6-polyprenyl-1,4-benzoquinol methylase UbiE [Phycisphaerales bacterium]|jgi:demethylmenaquinone methyltransferase/2-methoxy-6-polyprenyl-1,4-benzoquinol methylase